MAMQQYCLRWNNHQPNFISVFSSLLNNESLVDVTLAAEGRHLQAHKVVLSACSSYFQSLFTVNPCQHPIVILKDVKFGDLKVMVDFMYCGEVNVSQEQLPHILKTAEMLKIKGLADIPVEQSVSKAGDRAELVAPDGGWSAEVARQSPPLSPGARRKRLRKSSTGSGSGSAERAADEQGEAAPPTVIKSDPGSFGSDSSGGMPKMKTGEEGLQRVGSHESVDADMGHQVTLQVPHEVNISHNLEPTNSTEIHGPSTSQSQLTVTGMQWNVMDHTAYAQFTPCPSPTAPLPPPHHPHQTYAHLPPPHAPPQPHLTPPSPSPSCYQVGHSPPQTIQKRKRSINPQGDENFIRALEAVRFGGIGFCKAARMYGVNNRTLWLEYKKRGYPNFRLSIKHRKQENEGQAVQVAQVQQEQPQAPSNSAQNRHVVDNNKQEQSHAQRGQTMGTKRGRLLMRQPRIKRESDPSQISDSEPLSPQYLSVPPNLRVERQCSEPLPRHSPPPGHLLTVPGNVLVKQHSHPLLPSQIHAKTVSSPLQIQIIPHFTMAEQESGDRALSPMVVVTDPLSLTPHDFPLRADMAATAPSNTLRVRGDDLKRSASSPQSGPRSSHCPVVRPGPALGCNYCWNTVDTHGRILRRKTKYHCPECQTNLCIVPCFQEYHERHASSGQTDPIALTTSVMRMFPKTTSM